MKNEQEKHGNEKSMLKALERHFIEAVKSAVEGPLWLRRQMARAEAFQAALENKDCSKVAGLPGYTCPPNTKVMISE